MSDDVEKVDGRDSCGGGSRIDGIWAEIRLPSYVSDTPLLQEGENGGEERVVHRLVLHGPGDDVLRTFVDQVAEEWLFGSDQFLSQGERRNLSAMRTSLGSKGCALRSRSWCFHTESGLSKSSPFVG